MFIIDHASGYTEEKDLNLLYVHIDHGSGYVEEECVNKYLVFDSTKNIMMFRMELKIKSKK